jgi:hypothetical protein
MQNAGILKRRSSNVRGRLNTTVRRSGCMVQVTLGIGGERLTGKTFDWHIPQ